MASLTKVNIGTWQDQYSFSQAIEVSNATKTLYCSGQVSSDADGAPVNPGDMAAQIRKALDNLEAVLAKAGYGLTDVVRLNIYSCDVDSTLENWEAFNERFMPLGVAPSSTLLGVACLAFPEWLIEIEATAVK